MIKYFCTKRYLENFKDEFSKICEVYQKIFTEELNVFKTSMCDVPGDFSYNEDTKFFSLTISKHSTKKIIDTEIAVSTYLLTLYLQQCIINSNFMLAVKSLQISQIANFLKLYQSFDSISDLIEKFKDKFFINLASETILIQIKAMLGIVIFMKSDLINIIDLKERSIIEQEATKFIIIPHPLSNTPDDYALRGIFAMALLSHFMHPEDLFSKIAVVKFKFYSDFLKNKNLKLSSVAISILLESFTVFLKHHDNEVKELAQQVIDHLNLKLKHI